MPKSLLFLLAVFIGGTCLFVAQPFPALAILHWFPGNGVFYASLPPLAALIAWRLSRVHRDRLAWHRSLLIAFLVPTLIVATGLSLSREFHYLVFLAVGAYIIAAFAYWARGIVRQYPARDESFFAPFSWRSHEHRASLLAVVLLTAAFFGFALHGLSRFAAVDEPLWLDGRIGKFWSHIAHQRMDKTLISDKPGITVVWATGPALLVVEPSHYRETRHDYQAKDAALNIERYYFAFRFPLLVSIAALLPIAYLLLVRLVGRERALFGYAAIALSPVLIGMSKIVNPDSLLWVFGLLAFLSYLLFFERKDWRYLAFSGVMLGLALATKYVANFLIVFFFGMTVLYPLWQRTLSPETIRAGLAAFFVWLGTGIAVLYLAVPAFWVRPERLLASTFMSEAFEKVAWLFVAVVILVAIDQTVGKGWLLRKLCGGLEQLSTILSRGLILLFAALALFVLINGMLGMPWLNFMDVLASPKSSSQLISLIPIFLTHGYPLFFGTVPLILLGTGVLLIQTWRLRTKMLDVVNRLALTSIMFILLYYLGSTVNEVVLINRYQIMLYPLLALVGGIGLSVLLSWASQALAARNFRLPRWFQHRFAPIALGACLLAWTPAITDFPLSYASFLLPKTFTVDIKDMGAGSYEAAQYLNSRPDASTATIWTDKSGVCKFYVGPCLDGLTFRKLKNYDVRYLVLSTGRESRTRRMFTANNRLLNDEGLIRFDQYYDRTDPLFEFDINGRSSQSVKVFPITP